MQVCSLSPTAPDPRGCFLLASEDCSRGACALSIGTLQKSERAPPQIPQPRTHAHAPLVTVPHSAPAQRWPLPARSGESIDEMAFLRAEQLEP